MRAAEGGMAVAPPMRGVRGLSGAAADAILALLAAGVSLALSAAGGFLKLTFPGNDNDSLMRLTEVRDLIAGQDWFDLHQYRMGLEGGFVMHWSRLVDAPIAGLILLLRPLLGDDRAELAVQFIWPTLLFGLSVWLLVGAARRFGGEPARFPALVLGATALHFLYVFEPGSLDHHNVQIALVLAMTAGLLSGTLAAGLAAGAAAAASIAVGMETLPYVAAAGATAAALFWRRGEKEVPGAAGFGFGLALGSAAFLLVTVRPSQWTGVACDAFSGGQTGSAIIAGLGIAALCHVYGQAARGKRLAALCGLAVASMAYVLVAYPQCIADPYGGLDGRLHELWLSRVSEAQSLASMLANDPADAALYYVTPLIGLALLMRALVRRPGNRAALIVAPLLATAFAVSAWQVRGATFSLALASIPLAAWVGAVRTGYIAAPSAKGGLMLALSWLAAFNIVWGLAAGQIAGIAGPRETADNASKCVSRADFDVLAALPAGTVAAVSNLGSPILAFTGHRVLAGPYHRNIAGNLAALDIMTGDAERAHRTVMTDAVAYLAVCPGNPETKALAETAPNGLLARLIAGQTPQWLQPVPQTIGSNLLVFRTAE